MIIKGNHSAENPEFRKAVLQASLAIFDARKCSSIKCKDLLDDILKNLNLPMGDRNAVNAALSSNGWEIRFEKTKIQSLYSEFEEPSAISLNASAAQKVIIEEASVAADSISAVKSDFLRDLGKLKVVTKNYVDAKYGERLQKLRITTNEFLQNRFNLSQMSFNETEGIACLPGLMPNKSTLARIIMDEFNRAPIPVPELAERLGISFDKCPSLIKSGKYPLLMMWTDQQVWSLECVDIGQKEMDSIQRCLLAYGSSPIGLTNLFNCIFNGKIGMQLYPLILKNTKQACVDKALVMMGIGDYVFNPDACVYKKKPAKKNTSIKIF